MMIIILVMTRFVDQREEEMFSGLLLVSDSSTPVNLKGGASSLLRLRDDIRGGSLKVTSCTFNLILFTFKQPQDQLNLIIRITKPDDQLPAQRV